MADKPVSNRQRSWNAKIATLAGTKGDGAKRHRALNQMNMTGNEWIRAQVDLGMLSPKVLEYLNKTPAILFDSLA